MTKPFENSIELFEYDTSIETGYDFVSPIREALNIPDGLDMDDVHSITPSLPPMAERRTDQKTSLHDAYYKNIDKTDFYTTFGAFVRHVIEPIIAEPFYVQKIPTFRVHLPNNKAVGTYHNDAEFGHQTSATNIWVPVTDAYGTNTLHVRMPHDKVPQPLSVPFGSFIAFDAVNLTHGNEVNETGKTRVSFDFRVIAKRLYESSAETAINTRIPLNVGNYYVDSEDLK